MDAQAHYLVFHSAVVLMAGLLVGVPYGRAVRREASDQTLRAWRLAHDTLSLPLAAMTGQRGHAPSKPLSNQLVFAGNMVGLGASTIGALLFLYAAYVSLP